MVISRTVVLFECLVVFLCLFISLFLFALKKNKMSSEKKIKSGSVTGDQKQTIIDFMESPPHLAKGKFSASFTNEKATNLWQELTTLLNCIPGPIKKWKAWRRVSISIFE